jgi:hypothetical protein
MRADTSSFVCSAAKADSLVRGAAKPWLLELFGVGIGVGIGTFVERSKCDPDPDPDSDD